MFVVLERGQFRSSRSGQAGQVRFRSPASLSVSHAKPSCAWSRRNQNSRSRSKHINFSSKNIQLQESGSKEMQLPESGQLQAHRPLMLQSDSRSKHVPSLAQSKQILQF